MATLAAPAETVSGRNPGFSLKWLGNVLAHGYVWVWLAIFALPFLATLAYSLRTPMGSGRSARINMCSGASRKTCCFRWRRRSLTIIINLVIADPGRVRHRPLPAPGKSFISLHAEPFALHSGRRHGCEPGHRATPFCSAFRRR